MLAGIHMISDMLCIIHREKSIPELLLYMSGERYILHVLLMLLTVIALFSFNHIKVINDDFF